ncbi:MAG: hypothetical protein DME26_18090 [Verrucomicrobia bacterium]|nr:MAG: hypothetical protein DME26_18090 [Verrucomicrobiota bacterium]
MDKCSNFALCLVVSEFVDELMTATQLFGAMSPALAADILEYAFSADKELYRAALAAAAQARKLRPVYLERQPHAQRHQLMASALARPGLEMVATNLIASWLLKKHNDMLVDFLSALGVAHDKGAVEDLPKTIDDAVLHAAVDTLAAKYPREIAALYLHAFHGLNDVCWPNLQALLHTDPRFQLKPEQL